MNANGFGDGSTRNIQSESYWSSNVYASGPGAGAWQCGMANGSVTSFGQLFFAKVMLVRGGN